jgi:hypothetical protein
MGSDQILKLYNKCTELGLMEITKEKRRRRLFDLRNFGLFPDDGGADKDRKSKRNDGHHQEADPPTDKLAD